MATASNGNPNINLPRPGGLPSAPTDLEDNLAPNASFGLTDHGVEPLLLDRLPNPWLGLWLKRCLDVAVSLMTLIVAGLPMAIIALWIKLDSPGPVFYISERIGKNRRRFAFYKFRTMVVGAEQRKQELDCHNERHGPFFKMRNDPRITRAGSVLRKYSLDELPQLWNVLRGDMSLVGPRPHPVDDVRRYRPEHFCRLEATPGLTGLWQVKARRDPSFELNVALDVEYIRSWSFWLDLKILLQTIPVVLSGNGE